jgi:Secretion system C-terminal sorting domain
MRTTFFVIIIATGFMSYRSPAQENGTWMHRGATDTTQIACINDSLSTFRFPPNSMGMMLPDSVFCRAEAMCLDSLPFHRDSSFVGWIRFQMGTDSMHFNFMHTDSGHTGHQGMGFMMGISCDLHWDSLLCDSTFLGWHMTGVRQWNGTGWETVPGAAIIGSSTTFTTTLLSTAYAFVGEPTQVTSVRAPGVLPGKYRLEQNYPNPFNPSTNIGFQIADYGLVRLVVYDLLGREVAVLVNEVKSPGSYSVRFDASGLASGLYFYRLHARPGSENVSGHSGDFVATSKMIVLK